MSFSSESRDSGKVTHFDASQRRTTIFHRQLMMVAIHAFRLQQRGMEMLAAVANRLSHR